MNEQQPGVWAANQVKAAFDKAFEAGERKRRVIDTLDMMICRDGIDDIPVQIDILSIHHGSNGLYEDGARMPNNDDPDEVEFGAAFVTADMSPFTNGQSIELTADELEQAQEEYLNQ